MKRYLLALLCMLPVSHTWALAGTSSARSVVSLDGRWQLAVDSAGAFEIGTVSSRAAWRAARVPLSWQAQFADLRDYQGVAWYKKTVRLPRKPSAERLFLHFEAADYKAKVFFNGALVGEHEGGYLPFDFEVTRQAKSGANEILVRIMDPRPGEAATEGVRYWEIPHGKQSWYVQTSGLWRSVELRRMPPSFIERVHVTTQGLGGHVRIAVRMQMDERHSTPLKLVVRVKDPKGKSVGRIERTLAPGTEETLLEHDIASPGLWSPDEPKLYTLEAALENGDRVTTRFGFRVLEAKEGMLLLNNRPFYMIGALDQDFYPEGIYTTPSLAFLKDEMKKAKKMGLNTLRCHIKVPDRRYLDAADELGLIIWAEVPNWDVWTSEAAHRGEATLDGMLERDWNHPSLLILSIINESWGIDLQKPEERAWLKSAFDRAKEKAAGRLVVDNSACWGNFHVKTDINDYHTYWAMPERARDFDRTLAEFSKRPAWLFSPFGDAEERKSEPLILSEFGNWGLPVIPEKEPWWFARTFGDARVAHPQGVRERFKMFNYERVFGSYRGLAEESQRAQYEALKYEIEQLRLTPGIQGYIITEFTDVNWECNGLLDLWRNPKVLMEGIADIQQPDVIVARTVKQNFWAGESVAVALTLSSYQGHAAKIFWSASDGEKGTLDVADSARHGHLTHAALSLPAPEVKTPTRMALRFRALDKNGKEIAKNFCTLFVYPRLESSIDAALLVTDVLDERAIARAEEGGTVLLLVDSNTVLPSGFPMTIASRESAWYDGNWASVLNWIDDSREPFRGLAFGKHLGFEGSAVAPVYALAGIAPEAFKDVPSGMFAGWVHLNSAYIAPVRVGRGTVVLCTYRLDGERVRDPFASTLFQKLARYALGIQNEKLQLRWPLKAQDRARSHQ